jgi:hypothetical protein
MVGMAAGSGVHQCSLMAPELGEFAQVLPGQGAEAADAGDPFEHAGVGVDVVGVHQADDVSARNARMDLLQSRFGGFLYISANSSPLYSHKRSKARPSGSR